MQVKSGAVKSDFSLTKRTMAADGDGKKGAVKFMDMAHVCSPSK